ncbi:hypothetical protein IMG5_050820, partial [Ichthyophthirius multifiliis]
EETSEMFVDSLRGGQKIRVNLDIDFPKFPCDILSLDFQDIMGSHSVNVEGDLHKTRITKTGEYFDRHEQQQNKQHSGHAHDQSNQVDLQRIQQAIQNKEGCKLSGFMYVNRVPGNFHISCHAFGQILGYVFRITGINTIDLSHKINHLSFGDEDEIKIVKKQFTLGVLNPMDKLVKTKQKHFENYGISYNYYLNVVPTTYIDEWGYTYYVNQFVFTENQIQTDYIPAIYFRYDLSPVTVMFKKDRMPFLHFLVQVSAIVGGIFTIAAFMDEIAFKIVIQLFKNSEGEKFL